jgi:hypothetical protein
MRRILTGCAVAFSMTFIASAQDSTIKSKTEIKADDATVFSMNGCLRQDVSGNFTLYGTSSKSREGVTTESKVRTENDRDESKVTTTTSTKVDGDSRVGTAGTLSTFMLTPREGVALSKYVGQQVQLTAVVLDPDEKDAKVKVDEKVSVDPEHADPSSKRTKTEIEVEGPAAHGQFSVMSVKPAGGACK